MINRKSASILAITIFLFSCSEEQAIESTGEYRINKVVLDLPDRTDEWEIMYDNNNITMNGTLTSAEGIDYETVEYTLDEQGRIISITYLYENYCPYLSTYDYSDQGKIVLAMESYKNYPSCDLDDIEITTYYLNSENTFDKAVRESLSSPIQTTFSYETVDGNIMAIYENSFPDDPKEVFTYYERMQVPDNTVLINGLLSADENWFGTNLLKENGRLEGESTYYLKNEYEFDQHGNLTKIMVYRSENDNVHYRHMYSMDLSYERIAD